MITATSKWLTRCLGASCAVGALVLVGELQAQDFAYTNTNGTITTTVKNGVTIFGAVTNVTVFLDPGEAVVVTYTGLPVMNKDPK